jgi:hypothetical protein
MTNHSTATTGTHVAIEVVDRSQSTAFALIHELRAETRAAIEAALVLAETLGGAALRVARSATVKIDTASAASITDVERWLGGTLAKARETAHAEVPVAKAKAA